MNVPKKYQKVYISTFMGENGEKILVLTKVGEYGTECQKRFSIKNLLNEDYEVTEQTLEEENKLFRKPIVSSNK